MDGSNKVKVKGKQFICQVRYKIWPCKGTNWFGIKKNKLKSGNNNGNKIW